jgi:O-antigen/teichoic acid export membrane protein
VKQNHGLTQKAGRAVGFRLGGNMASALMGMGLGVILARILPPREFGVYGVGLGIVIIADILSSGGMFQALLQRKELSPEDEGTGFALQLGAALFVGSILIVSGPYAEGFFKMPGLGLLIQFQSVALLLRTFSLLPATRLQRRLAFDRLAFSDVTGRLVGGLVSIVFGLQGFGAFSLTAGSLTTAGLSTVLNWFFASGSIPLKFSRESARTLLGFGTGMLFIRVCNDLSRRVDVFIIGRQLGAEVVGLYQRAYQLMTIPLFQFTNTINQVLFPVMARLQDDDLKFRKGYLGAVALSGMVAFPMLTLLWTAGDILIPFLYGPRWEGSVPILIILSFVGYLRVINNPNGLVTQARAYVVAEGWRQAFFTVAIGVAVFVGSFWGLTGAALGVGVASFFYLAAMTRLSLSIAQVPVLDWLLSLRTVTVSTTVMAATALLVKWLVASRMSSLFSLILITGISLLAYLFSLRLMLSSSERPIVRDILRGTPRKLRWMNRLIVGPERPVKTSSPGEIAGVGEPPGSP